MMRLFTLSLLLDTQRQVEMNWNICKFLPKSSSCQSFFQIVIAGHIHAIFMNIQEDQRKQTTTCSFPVNRANDGSIEAAETTSTPDSVEFAQSRVKNELTEQLFNITQKIKKVSTSFSNVEDEVFDAQVLAAPNYKASNPALEFIKVTCKVLSLDRNTLHQVNKLRRDLLKLINVGEFSDDAIFEDPSLSFVIPEVICEYCNSCRDLDLCRDPYISRGKEGEGAFIKCPYCNNPYSLSTIESQLVNTLSRRSMAFTLQDVQCVKCRVVKADHMARYCECAGSFSTLMTKTDFRQEMNALRGISRYYNLKQLEDHMNFIDECQTYG